MEKSKKEILVTIDTTIEEICKWLQNKLSDSELYPVDAIKALAELILARASLEREYHSFSDSSKE